jgi:hypothetical protein
VPHPQDHPAAPRPLEPRRRALPSRLVLAAAIRQRCYAWLEEIRFRTGMTVLTGLLAVIGGAVAAMVLMTHGGRPGLAPRALASQAAPAGPPAGATGLMPPAHSIARAAAAQAPRPRHTLYRAGAVAAGASGTGRSSSPAAQSGGPNPWWENPACWQAYLAQWWNWTPPGWEHAAWDQRGRGHPGHGLGDGWGRGDGWGQGQNEGD